MLTVPAVASSTKRATRTPVQTPNGWQHGRHGKWPTTRTWAASSAASASRARRPSTPTSCAPVRWNTRSASAIRMARAFAPIPAPPKVRCHYLNSLFIETANRYYNNVFLGILGGWSEWSEWSECSRECGGGRQQRRRQCEGRGMMTQNIIH